jgi:hypothetical protein
MVRLPDLRSRIGHVAFVDGSVKVSTEEGKPAGLVGCMLRATWRNDPKQVNWRRQDIGLGEPGTAILNTAGVPAEMSILLVDGGGCLLDRYQWAETGGERPEELGPLIARVTRWVTEGEHVQLEYKRELGQEKVNRSFAETVVAFANGVGGIILVGVDDDMTVAGWDRPHARDQIVDIVRNLVSEPIDVQPEKVLLDSKPIWVVTVRPGDRELMPYRCAGRVMIRVHGSTREAATPELRRLVEPSAQLASASAIWGLTAPIP